MLYVEDSVRLGGDARTGLSLLERLDPRRFRITVATADHGPVFEGARAMAGITHLPCRFGTQRVFTDRPSPWRDVQRRLTGLPMQVPTILRLARYARRRGVDVIVSRDRLRSCLVASVVSILTGVPHVYYPATFYHHRSGRLRRFVARRATLVVGNSRFTTASYVAAGVPAERALTVYNSIDPAPYMKVGNDREYRRQVDLLADVFVFGWVGTWSVFKGVADVIEAFRVVHERHPEAYLLMVGGRTPDPYVRRVAELGLDSVVRLRPFESDVAAVYAAIDVFLMASHDEPFGRVTVEAMAAGRPVIGTTGGGTPEIVVPNVTGLLVPPRDPAALAEAMIWMIEHKEEWRGWGRAGRDRVIQVFSEERRVAEMSAVLGRF